MELSTMNRPETRYIGFRHIGAYNQIGSAIGTLFQQAMPRGIELAGPVIGVFHDDPGEAPEDQLRSDAAFQVNKDYDLEGTDLHAFTISAGDYVTYDHIGPYSELGDLWQKFAGEVMAQHGDSATWEWIFEEYLNDCEEVGMENAHTRLFVSLK